MSTLEVTVTSKKGKCSFGHEVGDRIIFDGKSVKGNICYSALAGLLPKVYAMRYDANFPWLKNKDIDLHACPDCKNQVAFEIRRINKKRVEK